MAIRTSSTRDVEALLAGLGRDDAAERDLAVARLRLLGARAHDRVIGILNTPTEAPQARLAALRVLDGVDAPKARTAVLASTEDAHPEIAVAALQVLKLGLATDSDTTVLERVAALAADDARPTVVRQAALDALHELPAAITAPLVSLIAPVLSQTPPLDDPGAATAGLARHHAVSLGVLHDLLTTARDRERMAADHTTASQWRLVRAGVHAVLATRRSRIALYDLRELFGHATTVLPLDTLTAMRELGDLTCLEAIGRAWTNGPDDAWWRRHLQDIVRAILNRERATSRHVAVKRLRTSHPGLFAAPEPNAPE